MPYFIKKKIGRQFLRVILTLTQYALQSTFQHESRRVLLTVTVTSATFATQAKPFRLFERNREKKNRSDPDGFVGITTIKDPEIGVRFTRIRPWVGGVRSNRPCSYLDFLGRQPAFVSEFSWRGRLRVCVGRRRLRLVIKFILI